jgi:rhodanese-related sulfurtransferase
LWRSGGHLAELEAARRRGLTLVCGTDKRSVKAAELLRQAGFADVTILRGSVDERNRQGFEIA